MPDVIHSRSGYPPVRVRRRAGRPAAASPARATEAAPADPAPAEPACPSAPETEAITDPEDARLCQVLVMVAAHKSQAEIAEHFGVSTRTVRNWITQAKERRLHAFKITTPEELLASTDQMHAFLTAKLLDRMSKAEAANGDRTLIECIRQIRAIERDRYLIRAKVGVFQGYKFNVPREEDEHTRLANELSRSARHVLSAFKVIDGDEPDPDEAENEDYEPLD